MSRQSKAEQALAKQCRLIVERITVLRAEVQKLECEMDALTFLHQQMQDEIANLKQARQAASTRLKP